MPGFFKATNYSKEKTINIFISFSVIYSLVFLVTFSLFFDIVISKSNEKAFGKLLMYIFIHIYVQSMHADVLRAWDVLSCLIIHLYMNPTIIPWTRQYYFQNTRHREKTKQNSGLKCLTTFSVAQQGEYLKPHLSES